MDKLRDMLRPVAEMGPEGQAAVDELVMAVEKFLVLAKPKWADLTLSIWKTMPALIFGKKS